MFLDFKNRQYRGNKRGIRLAVSYISKWVTMFITCLGLVVYHKVGSIGAWNAFGHLGFPLPTTPTRTNSQAHSKFASHSHPHPSLTQLIHSKMGKNTHYASGDPELQSIIQSIISSRPPPNSPLEITSFRDGLNSIIDDRLQSFTC